MTIRRFNSVSFTATSTAFSRLLNVPGQVAAQAGGYVEVIATDCVAQVRVETTVQTGSRVVFGLAGPGEPFRFRVPADGADITVRCGQITTYLHDPDGVPTATNNAASAGSVAAVYLPGAALPLPAAPRLVVDRRQVQAGTWAGATGYVSIPLGPPGLWRCVHAYWQLAAGIPTETSIELHVRSGKAGDDTPPVWLGRGGSATPSTSWIGSAVPGELESTAGPQMPGYMASGWGHLMLSANAAIAPVSVYFVESVWRFEGLALPDFRSRVVIS